MSGAPDESDPKPALDRNAPDSVVRAHAADEPLAATPTGEGGYAGDVVELLLPRETPARVEEAGRVVRFLRLLADDARAARADLVGMNLSSARDEMDRVDRTRLLELVTALFEHHLGAATPADSFLSFGSPRLTAQVAWSELAVMGRRGRGVPHFPEPGESPLAVAARLAKALRELGEEAAPLRRAWEAHICALREGAAAGEAAFRGVLEWHRRRGASPPDRIAAIDGVARCLLDQGAVLRARDWLERHLTSTSCDAGLSRLFGWTLLFAGDERGAQEVFGDLAVGAGVLPTQLIELRERMPTWLRWLPGRAAHSPRLSSEDPAVERLEPEALRKSVGASAVLCIGLEPGAELRLLSADVSPGLRERTNAWMRARDGACMRSGEPEHRVVARARGWIEHRGLDGPLRGALSESSLCVARMPILASDGEVSGWLHLEFEHHLAPSRARLEALARWVARPLLGQGSSAEVRSDTWSGARVAEGTEELGSPAPNATCEPKIVPLNPAPADGPLARALRRFVEELGMKTAQRRWWGIAIEPEPNPVSVRSARPSVPPIGELQAPDGMRLVAEGGERFVDWRNQAGGRRAQRRARLTAGSVGFGEPAPGLAMHAKSSSGVVVPIVFRGRVHGLFVVESIRKRDFRPADIERMTRAAARFAVVWRAAQFREWHLARHRHDVFFDPGLAGIGSRLTDLPVAGRSQSAAAIVGEEGSGRSVLARWLHFEGEDATARCELVSNAQLEASDTRAELFARLLCSPEGRSAGRRRPLGTVVFEDLDRLPLERQRELIGLAAGEGAVAGSGRPRWVATLSSALTEAVREGNVLHGLARIFERLELFVPPLRKRRDEIPAIVDLLLERFASEERLEAPRLEDGALALLWRQPWPRNVRELENLLYKLVLFHGGEEVGAETLRALADRFQCSLIKRLSSKRPEREDLLAALRTTRKASGAVNKTRAALYLGWDPDTLVARMRDAEIEGA